MQSREGATNDLKVMTPEETQVARNFLQNRFTDLPLDTILKQLDEHLYGIPSTRYHAREQLARAQPVQQRRRRIQHYEQLQPIADYPREQYHQQAYQPVEQSNLHQSHKKIDQREARMCLNELLRLVGKGSLTQDQRYVMDKAIKGAKEWMSRVNFEAFQTCMKIIHQCNTGVKAMISKKKAVQLFNTLVKRVSDNNLEIVHERERNFDEECEAVGRRTNGRPRRAQRRDETAYNAVRDDTSDYSNVEMFEVDNLNQGEEQEVEEEEFHRFIE